MRSIPVLFYFFAIGFGGHAQDIGPAGTLVTGGHGSDQQAMLSWSVGQISGTSMTSGSELLTLGIQQPGIVLLPINIKAFLDGPFDPLGGNMSDQLRSASLIPSAEPFTALGFQHAGSGGGEQAVGGAFNNNGNDAVVDWVLIELRDASDPIKVVSTRSAFVQRDGDVVDVDGISVVQMTALPGNYHVAVRHRNHLPVMTALPVPLTMTALPIDLTDGSVATYGTDAQRSTGGIHRLWAGDVTGDHVVKYVNTGNDRDPILVAIGGVLPTATAIGYLPTDVNMDGVVKYTGPANDRDRILITIGGVVATDIRNAQFP